MTAPFFVRPALELRLKVIDARCSELSRNIEQAHSDIEEWEDTLRQLHEEWWEIWGALEEGKVSI